MDFGLVAGTRGAISGMQPSEGSCLVLSVKLDFVVLPDIFASIFLEFLIYSLNCKSRRDRSN